MVSVIQQCKSAIIIHTVPPSLFTSPPPIPSLQVIMEQQTRLPVLHASSHQPSVLHPDSLCTLMQLSPFFSFLPPLGPQVPSLYLHLLSSPASFFWTQPAFASYSGHGGKGFLGKRLASQWQHNSRNFIYRPFGVCRLPKQGSKDWSVQIPLWFLKRGIQSNLEWGNNIHNHLLLYIGYFSGVFIKSLKFSQYLALAWFLHALASVKSDCAAFKINAFFHIFHFDFDGNGCRLVFILNWFVKSCSVSDNNTQVKILHCFIVYFLERQNQREFF